MVIYYILYSFCFGFLFVLDGTKKLNFKQFIGVKGAVKKTVIIQTLARLIFLILLLTLIFNFEKCNKINWLSIFLQICSLTLFYIAKMTMRSEWSSNIDGSQKKIVIKGVFSLSRNPVYIAYHLLFMSFVFLDPYVFIPIYIIFTLIFHFLILQEEKHLKDIFKNSYDVYCKNTRRYIPYFTLQSKV